MSRNTRRPSLTREEALRLDEIRAADGLDELAAATRAPSEEAAYFDAKDDWYELRDKELPTADERRAEGTVAGDSVDIGGHVFHVHGVTHTGTDEEREYLRDRVSGFVGEGETVYCEQGIRPMYFDDFDGVCEMDDYTWARSRCEALGFEGCVSDASAGALSDSVGTIASKLRDATFSFVDSGGAVYGDAFADAMADVASVFLTSHEDAATGNDFEAFRLRRAAAENPERLAGLQRYYKRRLLPQPLERDWLAHHDRELELFTHARNERIADYAVYHNEEAETVRIIVGAAHQPGVVEYLTDQAEGRRDSTDFEPVE